MKKLSKLFMFSTSCLLGLTLLSGCSETKNDDKKESEPIIIAEKAYPIVEDQTFQIKENANLTEETGYFNGFTSQDLVEFKVTQKTGDILRVFELGNDLSTYLKEEKQDGTSQFKLTYQESSDGITSPILVKIQKMNEDNKTKKS